MRLISNILHFVRQLQKTIPVPRIVMFIAEPVFRLYGMRRNDPNRSLSLQSSILIVRLDEIGDVVLTVPFIRELRRNCPQARITLITKSTTKNLMEICPYVNEVLTFDISSVVNTNIGNILYKILSFAKKNLWNRHYDIAIVPRFDADEYYEAYLAYFCGAGCRVGYSEKNSSYKTNKNKGFDVLYNVIYHENNIKHEVLRNLDLLRNIGGIIQDDALELWITQQDEDNASAILSSEEVLQSPIIAFGPSSGAPRRTWPIENFIKLGSWLCESYQAIIVIIGGPDACKTGNILKKGIPGNIMNLAGKTTLRESVAILKHCKLFIGNDSGPMHLAAAVQTPVIEISCHPANGDAGHYNSPTRFGPWGVPHEILQPETGMDPCSEGCIGHVPHCITKISISQVQKAVEKLLR